MFHVVRIVDGETTEGDLRPEDSGSLVVVRDVVALRHGGAEIVAHGDVLRVVVAMVLKGRHSAHAVVVTLQVHGRKSVGLSVVVTVTRPKDGCRYMRRS